MRSYFVFVALLLVSSCAVNTNTDTMNKKVTAAEKNIPVTTKPDWLDDYYDFYTQGSGCWITNNNEYLNEQEKAEAYGNDWDYAIAKNGLIGSLYGWESGNKTEDYWEFRIFWDGELQQVSTQQFGHNGMVAKGWLKQESPTVFIQEQIFSFPDGRTWKDKHRIELTDTEYLTTSYAWENEQWSKQREYTWQPCSTE